MKTTKEIIQDLNKLKASLRDENQTVQMEEVLDRLADRVIDLAKVVQTIEVSLPHKASQRE